MKNSPQHALRNKFGALLRQSRLESGQTQLELSRRLAWASPQRVSNIERGIELLSCKEAPKYCEALGLRNIDRVLHFLLEIEKSRLEALFGISPNL